MVSSAAKLKKMKGFKMAMAGIKVVYTWFVVNGNRKEKCTASEAIANRPGLVSLSSLVLCSF